MESLDLANIYVCSYIWSSNSKKKKKKTLEFIIVYIFGSYCIVKGWSSPIHAIPWAIQTIYSSFFIRFFIYYLELNVLIIN